ncbi:MAG: thiamine pyrophosphate-binding protein [Chloroflexi bacterium]|nr:thiamine pyrophosphate-binding protein [Chloroflexota bacterium]
MRTYKGAEIIVDYLIKERVPYLFGVCGHGIIGFLDAAYDRRDAIKTITTHDEQVAGFMADAYYRVTHQPIATYTSCGPGSLNLAMPVAGAFLDSSAFLAITGNVPTQQFNRGPFQETGRFFQGDFNSVMRPYVKRSYQAPRPDMLPLILRQAFAQMVTGRPGPVHLDVPLNVFVEETEAEVPEPGLWRSNKLSGGQGDPELVRQAAELLAAAERPAIVAGNGVFLSEAGRELRALAELLQIPVLTSPLGKGTIDETHALSLGATGRNGTHAANEAARTSDVLLALGTRFDDRATSAWLPGMTYNIPGTKLIHVDIDPQEIGRNYPATLGILADVRLVLQQLLELLRDRAEAIRVRHEGWVRATQEWKREWDEFLAPAQRDDAVPIRPDRLVADLGSVLPRDAIVLADVGVHHNWVVQQLKAPPAGKLLQSWGFAAMGFGVAGALGAQFAAPDQRVVAVCGDGGFLMTANAVQTAVEYHLPIVWVIWNNKGYISIRDQQAGFFGKGREIATRFRDEQTGELVTTDFAALARSMGADGVLVERPGDLREQISAALASGRPTVLDVHVNSEVHPPATGSWDLPPLAAPLPNYGALANGHVAGAALTAHAR